MIQAQRNYHAGERIRLGPDGVLEVQEGVVALTVIHEDGTEVLLGLYGPGQVLAGHPEDACCIQLYAHSETTVCIQPWTEAVRHPDFAGRLRNRLQTMEAWAAMQARPHLEQRLLGILSLLAEQFGRSTNRGMLIEVQVTQAQLASAVGATRTTVTCLLGRLRRRGLVIGVRSGRGSAIACRIGRGGGTRWKRRLWRSLCDCARYSRPHVFRVDAEPDISLAPAISRRERIPQRLAAFVCLFRSPPRFHHRAKLLSPVGASERPGPSSPSLLGEARKAGSTASGPRSPDPGWPDPSRSARGCGAACAGRSRASR